MAPIIEVSSVAVKIASILQGMSLSKMANICATPIPLSAPRVVPFAFKYPFSSITSIASLAKSITFPSSLSHTISVCTCKIIGSLWAVFFLINTL